MMFWGEQKHQLDLHASLGRLLACAQVFLFPLLFIIIAPHAQADPWVNAGNATTRHHLQYLHDQGRINLSLSTWPIAWADIDRELQNVKLAELNRAEAWSYQYLVHERSRAKKGFTRDKTLFGSNSLRPFSSFSDIQQREESFIRGSVSFHTNHIAGKIQTDIVTNPLDTDDQYLRLEGSYLATTAGNWVFGLGAIDRWWGPGWHSSLILSGASRAPAGIFINNKESLPINAPLLKSLGQWNVHAFATVLEEDRAMSEPVFAGLRITNRPFHNLELGVSRTAFAEGDGNPTYLESTESAEESYQLISYDARLTGYTSFFNAAIYGQLLEKRDDSTYESKKATLFGAEVSALIGDIHNRLVFELENQDGFSDTASSSPYFDNQYPFGYNYRTRGIAGNHLSGEKTTSISGEHHFKGGQSVRWKWQNIDNAIIGFSFNEPPQTFAKQTNINAEYAFPVGEKLLVQIGAFAVKEKITTSAFTIENGGYLGLHFRF